MRSLSVLLVPTLLVLFGCAAAEESEPETTGTDEAATVSEPADASSADDEAAIREFLEEWDPAFVTADADAMAAMFTEDAVRLSADQPMDRGRAEIREGFAEGFAEAAPQSSSNPIDHVGLTGDWAWAYGTWEDTTLDENGEPTETSGKWLSILRPTSEGWRFAVDTWNTNEPSAQDSSAQPLAALDLPPAAGETDGPAEDVEAIRAIVEGWETASEAGDVSGLANRFAEGAIRMPDRGPAELGVDAIRAAEEAAMQQGTVDEAIAHIDVIEVDGDWAWLRGHWGQTVTDASGTTVHDQGKWVDVLERTDDGWKIRAEIWNRDQPVPAPPAQ